MLSGKRQTLVVTHLLLGIKLLNGAELHWYNESDEGGGKEKLVKGRGKELRCEPQLGGNRHKY